MTEMARQRFTALQMIAIVLIAAVAGSVPALQPLLLGGLMQEGRLDAVQIGQAATAEALGMMIAATLAAAILTPTRLPRLAILAALIAAGANLLSTRVEGLGLVLVRGVNGLCSGLMLWLLVGLSTRATVPARVFALYVTAQASIAFLLSLTFNALLLPRFGTLGGYVALAGIDGVLVLLALAIPSYYARVEQTPPGRLPPVRGLVGLAGVALFLAGVMGFWVYVRPLMALRGHAESIVGNALTAAIGIQILAGVAASLLSARLRAVSVCIGGSIVSIVALATLAFTHDAALMFVALGAFSFCWMFVPPFHVPYLIALDPSHRAVGLVSAAQIGGIAVGPMTVAIVLNSGGLGAIWGVVMALFAIGAVLLAGALRMFAPPAGRRPAAQPERHPGMSAR